MPYRNVLVTTEEGWHGTNLINLKKGRRRLSVSGGRVKEMLVGGWVVIKGSRVFRKGRLSVGAVVGSFCR